MNLYKNMNKNIEYIKLKSGNNNDIIFRQVKHNGINITIIYCESVCSLLTINDFIMKSINLTKLKVGLFSNKFKLVKNSINSAKVSDVTTFEKLFYFLYAGFTCILIENVNKALSTETRSILDRGITTSITEPNIRGPKDSFTENYQKNVGLIRKRIKSESLWFDNFVIGKRSKTSISICYLNDVVEDNLVLDIKEKLNKIDIDGILDITYLKGFLTNTSKSSFPTIMATERPDLCANAILDGKVVIICENSPFALVLPSFFIDFINPIEDNYQNPNNVNFMRVIRFISFFITLLMPAYYIAIITYNQETIPTSLLINFTVQRDAVPFPAFIEALIMMIVFEILKEGDTRLPSAMGTSISILGALILGDAAVNAGIVSPIMIIVIAITFISSLLFNKTEFVNSLRLWRFSFMLLASITGIYGIVIGTFILIIHLSSIKTLGVPYLYPLSPISIKAIKDMLFKSDKSKDLKRSSYLTNKNILKQRRKEND